MNPPALRKGTGCSVDLVPQLELDGAVVTVVVIKERFAVDRRNRVRRLGDAKLRPTDLPWDDDKPDSLKYPSDVCIRKPSTDVIVVGSAVQAYGEPARTLDTFVRVGPVEKFLRVHGLRVWYRAVFGLALSPPEPFDALPLRWDLAFGGADFEEGHKPMEEARNPVGRGVARDPRKLLHQPGPQIEDPHEPIEDPRARPAPAGVAPIGRHWEPRRRFLGTTDELWKKERLPLLPADFDDRFNQAAPPCLVTPKHLRGGELVQVHNMCANGPLQFELPRLHFFVGARHRRHIVEHRAVLDTVLLEPNSRELEMTWRAAVRMPKRASDILELSVHEKERL